MSIARKYFLVFLKGMAMGAADSVPGVSGGTIAFITGIYEELIDSIRALNVQAVRILFTRGIGACWQHINGTFLFTLLGGILASLALFANLVIFLLDNYPLQLMAFFIGLILASCLFVAGEIHKWKISGYINISVGVVLSAGLSFIPQSQLDPGMLYIFFCAAIAICAMILPGISGAFILLLLGVYETVLNAARDLDLLVLGIFLSGCVVGLLSFSRFLAWMFHHHRDNIVSFLLGILAGSLFVIWPWRVPDQSIQGEHEHLVHYKNVLPGEYTQITGEASFLLVCIVLAVAGFLLVYGMEKFSANAKT